MSQEVNNTTRDAILLLDEIEDARLDMEHLRNGGKIVPFSMSRPERWWENLITLADELRSHAYGDSEVDVDALNEDMRLIRHLLKGRSSITAMDSYFEYMRHALWLNIHRAEICHVGRLFVNAGQNFEQPNHAPGWESRFQKLEKLTEGVIARVDTVSADLENTSNFNNLLRYMAFVLTVIPTPECSNPDEWNETVHSYLKGFTCPL